MLAAQVNTKRAPLSVLRRGLVVLALVGGICQGVLGDLTDYTVFANNDVSLGDNVTVLGGPIGNNATFGGVYVGAGLVAPQGVLGGGMFIEGGGANLGAIVMGGPYVGVGDNSVVSGDLDAGGDVVVGFDALITGDLTAGSSYTLLPGATVVGAATVGTPASVPVVTLPVNAPLPVGATDVTTSAGDLVRTLTPGAYGDVTLFSGSTLALSAGTYIFNSLSADDNLTVQLDLTGGDVNMFFEGDVSIGDGVAMTTTGSGGSYGYTNAGWTMGNGGNWTGTVYAPTGIVSVGTGFGVDGNLYADSVNVGSDSTITHKQIDSPPPIPAPPAVVLGAIGLALVASKRHTAKV